MAASAPQAPQTGENASRTKSLVQAAAILGVHRNTLSGWIDQGCPVVKRADRSRGVEWEISISDVFEWRVAHAVEQALASYQDESGKVAKEEADRRRAVANAISAEVNTDELLRSVVARGDAEADMAAFCVSLKTALSNACAKIAGRASSMKSAPEIHELCETELNRAFASSQAELVKQWMQDTDDGRGED